MTWRRFAACRDTDTDVFFPEVGGGTGNDLDYGPALAICQGCAAVQACLEEHIGETTGVFGGTTPRDRWRLLKRRRAVA